MAANCGRFGYGNRSGVASVGGEPVAALRSRPRSSSFGGSAADPWYLGCDVFGPRKSSQALAVHDVAVQAMGKYPANVE